MFRELIAKAFRRELHCDVVGATPSGHEAMRLAAKLHPEVVLLDLYLPDVDGFAVSEDIRRRCVPTPKILMISSECDQHTVYRVSRAGADGFVDKNTATIESLREAFSALQRNRRYFSPSFTAVLEKWEKNPKSPFQVLSSWERRVLTLIGEGLSDGEIASKLNLSPRTVQTHRSNILRKLAVKNTPKLMAYALVTGIARVSEYLPEWLR